MPLNSFTKESERYLHLSRVQALILGALFKASCEMYNSVSLLFLFFTCGIIRWVIVTLLDTSAWKPSSNTNFSYRERYHFYITLMNHLITDHVTTFWKHFETLPLACSSFKTLSPYIHHLLINNSIFISIYTPFKSLGFVYFIKCFYKTLYNKV